MGDKVNRNNKSNRRVRGAIPCNADRQTVTIPDSHAMKGEKEMRKELYEELIMLGLTPDEALEQISEMEFAEDYED